MSHYGTAAMDTSSPMEYCTNGHYPDNSTLQFVCPILQELLVKQNILNETLRKESANLLEMQKLVAALEYKLLVFGSVLFGLVMILFLGLALVILKLYLQSFLKCHKKHSHPERRPSSSKQCQYLGQIPSSTQNLRQLQVSTIRSANHQQSSESLYPAGNRIPRNDPLVTPISEEHNQQTAPPSRRLMRQPSESTCPTESYDAYQGCDNLALSTSTLQNQSISSTSTVNTVLSSGNSINQANYMNNRF